MLRRCVTAALTITALLTSALPATAAQRIITVDGEFRKASFYFSAFGSTLEALPLNISVTIEDSGPGFVFIPPGSVIRSDGAQTVYGLTLIPMSAVVTVDASIGDGNWSESNLLQQTLFDSGESYAIILVGDLDNTNSVTQFAGIRLLDFNIGDVNVSPVSCNASLLCLVTGIGWASDYLAGSSGPITVSEVTVRLSELPPAEQISDLKEEMMILGLNDALVDSIYAEDDASNGEMTAAVKKLEAFIGKIEAQRGKKLTDEQADDLIARAQSVIDALSS